MKVLVFIGVVVVGLLEWAVAEHGCTNIQHCNHTVCTSTSTSTYELHCLDNYCVCTHVTIPAQTCDKANGNSDCTKNTCTRHDFGPIHYEMKCIHSYRTNQNECHCTATYSHHGGGGIGGGINGGTPDLGNILAGQTP